MNRWFAVQVLGFGLLAASVACSPAAPAPAPAPKATEKPAAAPTPSTPGTVTAATPASKASPKTLEKVKIMVPAKSVSFLPEFMGNANGTFKEEGLDLEVLVLQSNLGLPALLKGEVDYVDLLQPTLRAAFLGEAVRIVMGVKAKTRWQIILAQGLTSVEQIKGKAVGVDSLGSFNQYAGKQGLKYLGLDPDKDVTWVPLPPGGRLPALQGGSVAAAVLSPPEGDKATAAGYKEILNTVDVFDIVTGGIGTSLKRIQENPDQVKRLMRAMIKSQAYTRDHKEETVQYVMAEFSLDRDIADKVVTAIVKEYGYDGEITDKGLASAVEVTHAEPGPAQNATLEDLKKGLDLTLLRQVQKELGLSR